MHYLDYVDKELIRIRHALVNNPNHISDDLLKRVNDLEQNKSL